MIQARRLLFALPAVIGSLVTACLMVAVVWPQWQQVHAGRIRVAELRELEAQLPRMARQLEFEQKAVARVQDQKTVVLELIEGRGTLATLMAQLDRIAAASGVALLLMEPLPAGSLSGGGQASGKSNPTGREKDKLLPAPTSDLLQASGLGKQELLLTVSGRYPALLHFMRGLEQANPLMVQRNLQLGLPALTDKAKDPAVRPVILKMTVSTYANPANQDLNQGSSGR